MRARKSPEQWSALLDELSGSGESVESFCRRRGIRRSTLYWWRWKLGASRRSSGTDTAIRLQLRRPLFCDPLSVVRVTHPIARVGARKWPDRDPPGDANRRRVVARRRASREGGRGHRVGVHALAL